MAANKKKRANSSAKSPSKTTNITINKTRGGRSGRGVAARTVSLLRILKVLITVAFIAMLVLIPLSILKSCDGDVVVSNKDGHALTDITVPWKGLWDAKFALFKSAKRVKLEQGNGGFIPGDNGDEKPGDGDKDPDSGDKKPDDEIEHKGEKYTIYFIYDDKQVPVEVTIGERIGDSFPTEIPPNKDGNEIYCYKVFDHWYSFGEIVTPDTVPRYHELDGLPWPDVVHPSYANSPEHVHSIRLGEMYKNDNGDNAYEYKCENCGHVREIPLHVFEKTESDTDDLGHVRTYWRCKNCGESVSTIEHEYDSNYVCSICFAQGCEHEYVNNYCHKCGTYEQTYLTGGGDKDDNSDGDKDDNGDGDKDDNGDNQGGGDNSGSGDKDDNGDGDKDDNGDNQGGGDNSGNGDKDDNGDGDKDDNGDNQGGDNNSGNDDKDDNYLNAEGEGNGAWDLGFITWEANTMVSYPISSDIDYSLNDLFPPNRIQNDKGEMLPNVTVYFDNIALAHAHDVTVKRLHDQELGYPLEHSKIVYSITIKDIARLGAISNDRLITYYSDNSLYVEDFSMLKSNEDFVYEYRLIIGSHSSLTGVVLEEAFSHSYIALVTKADSITSLMENYQNRLEITNARVSALPIAKITDFVRIDNKYYWQLYLHTDYNYVISSIDERIYKSTTATKYGGVYYILDDEEHIALSDRFQIELSKTDSEDERASKITFLVISKGMENDGTVFIKALSESELSVYGFDYRIYVDEESGNIIFDYYCKLPRVMAIVLASDKLGQNTTNNPIETFFAFPFVGYVELRGSYDQYIVVRLLNN